MRHYLIRTSFLFACASFALSTAHAMESEILQETPSPLKLRPQSFQIPIEKQCSKDVQLNFNDSGMKSFNGKPETAFVKSCYIGVAKERPDQKHCFTVKIYFNERYKDEEEITNIVHNDLGELGIYEFEGADGIFKSNISYYKEINKFKFESEVLEETIINRKKLNTFSKIKGGYADSYVILSQDQNIIGQFLCVFANLKLIPYDFTNSMLKGLWMMNIQLEDFNISDDRLITRINNKIDEMQKAGFEPTINSYQEIALEELDRIPDPKRRAAIAWDLIQKIKKPKYFDRHTLINLCKQINQKDMPFFTEAAILKADLSISEESSEINIKTRYMPSIGQLLDIDDYKVQRVRTTFANAYIGNGAPSQILHNLSISKQTVVDLLNVAQERDLRIKEQALLILKLQTELKDLKDQK